MKTESPQTKKNIDGLIRVKRTNQVARRSWRIRFPFNDLPLNESDSLHGFLTIESSKIKSTYQLLVLFTTASAINLGI